MPVVAMDDLRCEAEELTGGEGCAGQHEEAHVLIGIGGVERAASVERRTVDEVGEGALGERGTQDGEPVGPRAYGKRDLRQPGDRLGGAGRTVDEIVTRSEESHVVARAVQMAGEGA